MKRLPVTMTAKEQRFGLVYFLFQLLILPALLMQAKPFLSDGVINILFYIINLVCVMLIFHRYLKRSVKYFFRNPWEGLRIAAVCLIVYFAAELLFALAVRQFYPVFYNRNDAAITATTATPGAAVCLVLLVPIAEETLYRGLLFDLLKFRSRIPAFIVSAAVFCFIHMIGYIGRIPFADFAISFLQYVPAGLCLGYAYVRSGSILTPILIHMAVNQIGMFSVR